MVSFDRRQLLLELRLEVVAELLYCRVDVVDGWVVEADETVEDGVGGRGHLDFTFKQVSGYIKADMGLD